MAEQIEIQVGPEDDRTDHWKQVVTAKAVKGGLALHESHNRLGYSVTHIGSGLTLLQQIPSIAAGRAALDDLEALGDWTRDVAEISEEERASLRPKLRKVARTVGAPRPKFKDDP